MEYNKILGMVKEAAASQYSDETALNAFMEGFEKSAAGYFNNIITSKTFQQELRRSLGSNVGKVGLGLGASLLGAAIVKGVNTVGSKIDSSQLRAKFEQALQQVSQNNRVVKGSKPERVRDYAETIFKFAPHVAADQNLLSSILANAVLGEGIDPQTIKVLTELESRYIDSQSSSPLVGIRT